MKLGRATRDWDYLVITAANERQALGYQKQIQIRKELGLLGGFAETLVLADPQGVRIGSGGSTLLVLLTILDRELRSDERNRESIAQFFDERKILILHSGGDSRRVPAYGACGKLFTPMPTPSDSGLAQTLFDVQLPIYAGLHGGRKSPGGVFIASGDVLVRFDPKQAITTATGFVGFAVAASPESASRHGVYVAKSDGQVRRFLQKPSIDLQRQHGAIRPTGESLLDVGIVRMDSAAVVSLLEWLTTGAWSAGWNGPRVEAIQGSGLDFYREILCCLGAETTFDNCSNLILDAGSRFPAPDLRSLFNVLHSLPFHACVLDNCEFLHFGTARQLLESGREVNRYGHGGRRPDLAGSFDNCLDERASIDGVDCWVEACRIADRLTLAGANVVVGADIEKAVALPSGACLDILPGRDRNNAACFFVRVYRVDDDFVGAKAIRFCGSEISHWLEQVEANVDSVWPTSVPTSERSLWNARLFPRVASGKECVAWLWMLDPSPAQSEQKEQWRNADRYSLAEMTLLADTDAFWERRRGIRSESLRRQIPRLFHLKSGFSAEDLAHLWSAPKQREAWLNAILRYAGDLSADAYLQGAGGLTLARIAQTIGKALGSIASPIDWRQVTQTGPENWRGVHAAKTYDKCSRTLFALARDEYSRAIVGVGRAARPQRAIRADEIVWGRAPARLDLGGGWTDTPPYTLEHGGAVLNAAVNLNGQPPIQVYARVTETPVIRLHSIDLGRSVVISELAELHDFRDPNSDFALLKAALSLAGFSVELGDWPESTSLKTMLEAFGGGIEVTTLAGIPKGSGLGTSSILVAAVVATLNRVFGRPSNHRELFLDVLKVEQLLTTGGGWQDQVGGVLPDLKLVQTNPGVIPIVTARYVPADLLDPQLNGGATLLYYSGITRLAKDILQKVVGRYLSRDRLASETLRELRRLPKRLASSLARKQARRFGELLNVAWALNKQLDPGSSTEEVDAFFEMAQPYIYGGKLLGAGGGGFALLACKSPTHAQQLRQRLEANPPNDRARFFDFSLNHEGLVVTSC